MSRLRLFSVDPQGYGSSYVVAAIDHIDAARKTADHFLARFKPTSWRPKFRMPEYFQVWRVMDGDEFQENVETPVKFQDEFDEDTETPANVLSNLLMDGKKVRL